MQIGNGLAKLHEIRQLDHELTYGEEVRLKRKIVICGERMRRRADDGTEIMPPTHFLKELWAGKFLD